jgi:hypothetical protein
MKGAMGHGESLEFIEGSLPLDGALAFFAYETKEKEGRFNGFEG